MDIIVKRGRGRPPAHAEPGKMSVDERRSLEDRHQALEMQLKGGQEEGRIEVIAGSVQDKAYLEREFQRTGEILDRDESRAAKGKEKDRLESHRKEIAEKLQGLVPPIWLQKAKSGTPDYQKAVAAGERANRSDVGKLYDSYKDTSRRLDPDNPYAGNISEVISK